MKTKNLFLTLLFYLSFFQSNAQLFNWNLQFFNYTKTFDALSLDNGKWLVGLNFSDEIFYGSSNGQLLLVDSEGTTLWEDFSLNGITGRKEFIKFLREDDIVFILVNSTVGESYILKYLIEENELSFIDMYFAGGTQYFFDMAFLPNGDIVGGGKNYDSISRSYIAVISQDFEIKFEAVGVNGFIEDVEILDENSFITVGNFNDSINHSVRKYDLSYNHLGNFETDFNPREIKQTDNGKIFSAKNRRLYLLNDIFETDSVLVLPGSNNIIDLKIEENIIYALIEKDDVAVEILEIDDELNIIDSYPIENPDFRASSFLINADTFSLIGFVDPTVPTTGGSPSTERDPSTSACIYSFVKNEPFDFPPNDLEVESVEIAKFKNVEDCGDIYDDLYNLDLQKVNVQIVNRGEQTIDQFHLFMQTKGVFNCLNFPAQTAYHLEKINFEEVNLSPGDSMVVSFLNTKIPRFIADTSFIDICVWATAVNGRIDTDLSNNYFCGQKELIQTISANPEAPIVTPHEEEVLIYPNPANDWLAVSLKSEPFEFTSIEFFDVIGRKVKHDYISARAKYKELDLTNLPRGIYFVRVKNDLFEKTISLIKN